MTRILFVDDNRDILKLAQLILQPKGYHIYVLDNGYNIEAKVENIKPDIIFLDVHLHTLDGKDICKQLKNNFRTAHLPIILFSSDLLTTTEIEECDADGFITKPFEIDQLVKEIENCKIRA